MNTEIKISGPFGSYPANSAGGILNSLCNEGVPLNTVERLTLNGDGTIKDGNKEFARYKFFEGVDKPLFYFQDETFARHGAIWHDVNGEKVLRPKLSLGLYHHGNASLVLWNKRDGSLFTEELYDFIKTFVAANVSHVKDDSPDWMKQSHQMYKIRQDAGAFFQGGSSGFNEGFVYIEFWKPEGAQAFVDYINNNFIYKDAVYVEPDNY